MTDEEITQNASPKLRKFMRVGTKIALFFLFFWAIVSLIASVYSTFFK